MGLAWARIACPTLPYTCGDSRHPARLGVACRGERRHQATIAVRLEADVGIASKYPHRRRSATSRLWPPQLAAAVDVRAVTGYQDFVDTAPLDLVYVAHHSRMYLVPAASR